MIILMTRHTSTAEIELWIELVCDVLVLQNSSCHLQVHPRENFNNVFVSLGGGVLVRGEMAVDETEIGALAGDADTNRALVRDGSQSTSRNSADNDLADPALEAAFSTSRCA